MKAAIIAITGFVTISLWIACKQEGRYLDLNSGKRVELEKDAESGLMVKKDSREPVEIYVDTETNDTIYGRTGEVINGSIVKAEDGKYKYDDGSKTKMDEDGDYKVKADDYKKKVDEDGDVKIKNGDTKTKIDGETGERKVKDE
jgi:hypothetical protein